MSEITRGVIGMPYEMAMESELSRRQFYNIAQGLLAQNETLTKIFSDAPSLPDTDVEWLERTRVLEAEINALRTGLGDAKYRIEQGRVWNGMGWTLTGLSSYGQEKAMVAIDAALAYGAKP